MVKPAKTKIPTMIELSDLPGENPVALDPATLQEQAAEVIKKFDDYNNAHPDFAVPPPAPDEVTNIPVRLKPEITQHDKTEDALRQLIEAIFDYRQPWSDNSNYVPASYLVELMAETILQDQELKDALVEQLPEGDKNLFIIKASHALRTLVTETEEIRSFFGNLNLGAMFCIPQKHFYYKPKLRTDSLPKSPAAPTPQLNAANLNEEQRNLIRHSIKEALMPVAREGYVMH